MLQPLISFFILHSGGQTISGQGSWQSHTRHPLLSFFVLQPGGQTISGQGSWQSQILHPSSSFLRRHSGRHWTSGHSVIMTLKCYLRTSLVTGWQKSHGLSYLSLDTIFVQIRSDIHCWRTTFWNESITSDIPLTQKTTMTLGHRTRDWWSCSLTMW